jgi:hypothetical protein
MILQCPFCVANVDCKVHGEYEYQDDGMAPTTVALLECPQCHTALISRSEAVGVDDKSFLIWGDYQRVWPLGDKEVDYRMPSEIRNSIAEAKACYQVGAFNACAVMCGRALEGICVHYKLKNKMLAGGLKELVEKDIIDKKIFSWGDELRKHRNIGAHFGSENITKEDAIDILDFTLVICDYVFVFGSRFEEFKKRKLKSTLHKERKAGI